MLWCLGRVTTQTLTSPILVILRCSETSGADGDKSGGRVGAEDCHSLRRLVGCIVRVKSLGDCLFLSVHSLFPIFHCTLVDHHDHVEIIMKETCLLFMIRCYSQFSPSWVRTHIIRSESKYHRPLSHFPGSTLHRFIIEWWEFVG